MGIWPGVLGAEIPEVATFENVASIIHFLAAILFCSLGCGGRFFLYYTVYQLITTLVKTLLVPGETMSDWTWDIIGDIVEYLAGMGLAIVIGVKGKLAGGGRFSHMCSHRGMLILFASLMTIWAVVLVRYLSMA